MTQTASDPTVSATPAPERTIPQNGPAPGAVPGRRWGILSDMLDVLAALAERAPVRVLVLFCLWQFVLWTVVPALTDRTPPNDALEEFLWSREWVLVNYKHPHLPAWAMAAAYQLTGSYIWGGYALAQAAVVTTFVLVWLLGRDLMGGRAALAGVLLLTVTGFFSSGTRQFNHDIAQLPFWAAIAWLLWRAVRDDRLGWWIALGLAGGIGLYAKLSTGVIMAFGTAWLMADPLARSRWRGRGPWVALAIVLGSLVPMLWAMAASDFAQIRYIGGRDDWVMQVRGRFYYIGVQAAMLVLLPVALWSAGLIGRAVRGRPALLLTEARPRRYLLWMGLGPAVLMALASLVEGVGEAWGKTMYNLIGLCLIALLGARLTPLALRRVLTWGFGMVLFTAAFHAAWTPVRCLKASGKPPNICIPGPQVAAVMQDRWHQATAGAPLGIVAGLEFPMMVTGAFATDRPSMFTHFSTLESPWITPERIARQGMMILWRGDGPPPDAWRHWTGGRAVGHESFVWQPGKPPFTVGYVIIPPGGTAAPIPNPAGEAP